MERRSAVRGRCEGGPRPRRGRSALGSWQGVRSGTPRAGDGAPRWGGRTLGGAAGRPRDGRAPSGCGDEGRLRTGCGGGAVAGSVARVSRRRRWSAVRATAGRCRLAGFAGGRGPGAVVGRRGLGRSCPASAPLVSRPCDGRAPSGCGDGGRLRTGCGGGAVAGSVARVSRRRRWSAVRATGGRCRLAGSTGADGPGAAVGASAGSVVRATAGRRRLIRGWAAPGDRAPRWGGRRFSRPAPTNPALQPPAACTRARITRTSSPISGCHWTPRTQGDDGSSIASTVPSAAWAVGIRPSPSRSTAWWW